MENRKSFLQLAATFPRRYTTTEGWRKVQDNVYTTAGAGLFIITIDPEFDPDRNQEGPSHLTQKSIATLNTFPSPKSGATNLASPELNVVQKAPSHCDAASGTIAASPSGLLNPFDDCHTIDQASGSQNQRLPRHPPAQIESEYHVFPRRKKWLVIVIIGGAGLFSGLSSNIYFPALQAIANDLQVSLGTVSLTITSYLIIQGIAPVFWGTLSDTLGRRPIYLASFGVYIISNIALSFSPNFAELLIFRGLQAAGSASTVSMGNGVIQDISSPAERAAFISFYQAIRNFSIAIGPVLGGILSHFFGFRSIFIFLLSLSLVAIGMIAFFLPETLRSVAGNGSLRLRGIYLPLIYKVFREPEYWNPPEQLPMRQKLTATAFIEPFKLLAQGDIFSSLLYGGVVYAVWSMVTASTTGLFKARFGLSELLIGLAFLPNGLGTIVGSAIIGKLMTEDFKAAEVAYKVTRNIPQTTKLSAKNLPIDFPIERTRLRRLPWVSGVFVASTAAYGFSLASPRMTSLPGWIAVPLMLQFLIAAASNAVFALNQTLISDLCPGRGASSTAINNLVRCSIGAIGVALIEGMLVLLGPAPTFFGLALISVSVSPFAAVSWVWGGELRTRRMNKKPGRDEEENLKVRSG